MRTYLFSLLFLLFIACKPAQQPKNFDAPDYVHMTGLKVYETYCVACHGADGKMGFSGAKDLSMSSLSFEERTAIIKNGKGVMNAFEGIISEEEIRRVSVYLDTLLVQ